MRTDGPDPALRRAGRLIRALLAAGVLGLWAGPADGDPGGGQDEHPKGIHDYSTGCSFCPEGSDASPEDEGTFTDYHHFWWQEDASKKPWLYTRSPWGVKSKGDKSARRRGYESCRLATRISCPNRPGSKCWATRPFEAGMQGLQKIGEGVPAWLVCGALDCGAGSARWTPITGLLTVVFAVALAVLAGRVLLERRDVGTVMVFLATVLLANVAAQSLGRGGGATLWTTLGQITNLGGAMGTAILENAMPYRDRLCHQHHSANDAGNWGAWVQARRAMELYMRYSLDVTSSAVGVARSLLPEDVLGGVLSLFGAAKTATTDGGRGWLELLQITKFMFAMAVGMAAITAVVNTLVLILETVMTATLSIALLPLTILLGVFKATRGGLRATINQLLAVVVTLTILGATTTIAIALTAIGTDRYIIGVMAHLHEKQGETGKTGQELMDEAVAAGDAPVVCGYLKNWANEAILGIRGIRSTFQAYTVALGCKSTGESDVTGTTITGSPEQWLWPVLLFTITILASAAVVKLTAGIASELTSYQGGALASQVAQKMEQAGQTAGQRAGRMVGRLGGR